MTPNVRICGTIINLAFCLCTFPVQGQSVVSVRDSFSSTDTILNFIRHLSLNAWDLRCIWNDSANCYGYTNSEVSGCKTSNPNFFPGTAAFFGCALLNGMTGIISFNEGLGLTNVHGSTNTPSLASYSNSLVWLGSGYYVYGLYDNNPFSECPQYNDSIHHAYMATDQYNTRSEHRHCASTYAEF